MVRKRPVVLWVVGLAGSLLLAGAVLAYPTLRTAALRTGKLLEWLGKKPDLTWKLAAGSVCGGAPFEMPTSGYIGYLWDDSLRLFTRHQGLDIFGGTPPSITPVYAAYGGYLTRRPDWKSSVIIRIPSDPLHPGRQIWTYYTHMADPQGSSFIDAAFPPGTSEVYVATGTRLGYQGDYSGDPNNPVGVHLHFSIVRDDGKGGFLNELQINNTLDPSPYLGMVLNGEHDNGQVPHCQEAKK